MTLRRLHRMPTPALIFVEEEEETVKDRTLHTISVGTFPLFFGMEQSRRGFRWTMRAMSRWRIFWLESHMPRSTVCCRRSISARKEDLSFFKGKMAGSYGRPRGTTRSWTSAMICIDVSLRWRRWIRLLCFMEPTFPPSSIGRLKCIGICRLKNTILISNVAILRGLG